MARSPKSSKGSTKQPEESDQPAEEVTQDNAEEVTAEDENTESVEAAAEESEVEAEPTEVEAEAQEISEEGETAEDDASDNTVEKTAEMEEAVEAETPEIPAHVEPEPMPEAPVAANASEPPSGAGAMPMVFGGIVAGAIGFAIATFVMPGGSGDSAEEVATLRASMDAQSNQIDALLSELDALKAGSSSGDQGDQIAAIDARVTETLGSLDTWLNDLGSQLDDLDARIAEVETRPALPAGADGSAAMEAQLQAFRQQLDTVTAEAEAKIAEAQNRASEIEVAAAKAAKVAERETALAAINASLDNGTAFSDALAVFPDAPDDLKLVADKGVSTLSSLSETYPDAARAALSSVQTVPEDASATERFTAFLKRQTNARSLAPREGDDPDAILSRAEAALAEGDLATVLSELGALPDPAKDAMSDWIAAVSTRDAALRASALLATATN